jgi:hypothetical protein
MNYFEEVSRGSQTPHIHPLLLSLCEAWKASDTFPDIHSISEDDPRVIGSAYYISPSELPPLNWRTPGIGSPSAARLQDNSKGKHAIGMLGSSKAIILYSAEPRYSQQLCNSRSWKRY